ncbi:hypothetical protein HDV00_010370 [Rhizophlyctis rosea]|nr:hypothetical protein HDV00_010370 [Rhizophlyctis rosea]
MKAKGTQDWVTLLPGVVNMINQTITFATGKTPDDIENDESIHEAVGESIQAKANKRYKGKASPTESLEADDYVRWRLTYDYHKIRKGSKEGYWRPEMYQIVKVFKNRKNPNITDSYKIMNVETEEIVKGLIPRGELMKVPPPEEMQKIPEVERRPGPVEGTADSGLDTA